MGRMQREKGKIYERAIAAELRARWPGAVMRRASQAERADQPDVFCEGGPPVLARLWLELQDARKPRPAAKLAQAEGDILRWTSTRIDHEDRIERLPVVVWHRLGERSSSVTTRLWVLGRLAGWTVESDARLAEQVTLELGEFLDLLARCAS